MRRGMRPPPPDEWPCSAKKKRKRSRLGLEHPDGSIARCTGNSVYSETPWRHPSWLAGGGDRGPRKLHRHHHSVCLAYAHPWWHASLLSASPEQRKHAQLERGRGCSLACLTREGGEYQGNGTLELVITLS